MSQSSSQIASIPGFYNGRSVFITGGSGFLGKVLVEKLLRSCPGIENIYLLVLEDKSKSIEESHHELTSSRVYDIIREQNPEALKKIVLIEGDASKLNLGISKEDRELLINKVSVIFHSAATVKFIETFKNSVNLNLRALDELLKLGKEVKDLKAFVHISTAYTNWFQPIVKEQFYPNENEPNDVINLTNSNPEEKLAEMIPKLFGKHVNVYTFTKNLAEHLAVRTPKEFPLAIVRPSVVGASMAEPYVGWVDNYTAATPLVDQTARGVLRALLAKKNLVFDVIPVDIVINQIIAVSWKIAFDRASKLGDSTPPVFNCVSGCKNPITIKEICQYSRDAGMKSPSDLMRWYPQTRFYRTKTLFKLDVFLTHYIPALLSDVISKLKGEPAKAVKYQKMVQYGASQYIFIMNTPIKYQADNYQKLFASMNKADQKVFNFDPQSFNWKTYMDDFYAGIRKFKTNDKSACTLSAQRKLTRLKYAHFFVTGSMIALSLFALKKADDEFKFRDTEIVQRGLNYFNINKNKDA